MLNASACLSHVRAVASYHIGELQSLTDTMAMHSPTVVTILPELSCGNHRPRCSPLFLRYKCLALIVQFSGLEASVHVKDGESTTVDAGSGFVAAAMGLIFDVDDYDKSVTDDQVRIIDTFFDSMKWTATGEPEVDVISYGAIMNMADFENRWIYKGSVTTPPCAENVYWNVLSTVYPIKQRHLDAFKTKLDEGTAGLAAKGNWRLIQDLKGQQPALVKKGLASSLEELAKNPEKAGGLVAATVIFAVIAFFALIGCAVFGYQAHSKGESAPAEAKAADVEMAAAAPAEGEAKVEE